MTYEYRAPEGRPRSCPPSDNHYSNGSAVVEMAPVPSSKSARWYATRATPKFRKKFSKALKVAYGKQARQARREAEKLNKNEKRGMWLTTHQYAKMAGVRDETASGRFRRWNLERRIFDGLRYGIFLVPHDRLPKPPTPAAIDAPPDPVMAPSVPPPPTLWRRMLGWLGF